MMKNPNTKDKKYEISVDKIDFEELVKEYKVQNENIFISYLNEIFKVIS